MKRRGQLIIDCGASRVTAAVFSAGERGLCLERLETVDLQMDPREEAEWPAALAAALQELGQRGLSGAARFLLPGHLVLTKAIRVPEVEASRRKQVVAFEAQQAIPYSLGEIVWDSQVVASDGVETEVLFIAAKKEVIELLCRRIRDAGFEPESIGTSTIAGINTLRQACPDLEGETLLATIGARTTTLVFSGQGGWFVRNVSLGGSTLTQTLVEQTGGTFEVAEALKCSGGGDSALAGAADAFARRVGQEITRSQVNYRRQKNGGDPQRILLAGRGSLLQGLPAYLSGTRNAVVDYFDPLRNVSVADSVEIDGTRRLLLTDLVGEAVRPYLADGVGVDLLPPKARSERLFARRKPVFLVAAACLVLAPLAPWLAERGAADEAERRIVDARARVANLQSLRMQVADQAEIARGLREALGRIEGLVAGKSNWIRFLAELQASLAGAGDVWLDELEVFRGPGPDGKERYEVALSGQMLLRGGSRGPGEVDQEAVTRRINGIRASFEQSEFVVSAKPPVITWTSLQQGLKVLPFRINLVVDPSRPI